MTVGVKMSCKTYDVTLQGWGGGTDATDHLVKWVKADSLEQVTAWCSEHLSGYTQSIDYMDDCDEYQKADGVDGDIADFDYSLIEIWKHEVDNVCPYCGGRCPTDEKYSGGDHLCDGFSGDIDELISS